jgi:hypothetical protein
MRGGLPRSLAELRHAMPGITLILPGGQSRPRPRRGGDPSFMVLAREYGKYLAAEARLLLPRAGPAVAADL